MNRFTDLSRKIRDDIATEQRAKETAAERAAREAAETKKLRAELLDNAVLPILNDIRDGFAADDVKADVRHRGTGEPAIIFATEGRLTDFGKDAGDGPFYVGSPAVCTVTTEANAFIISLDIPGREKEDSVVFHDELDEALFKAAEKMLRYHHKPIKL